MKYTYYAGGQLKTGSFGICRELHTVRIRFVKDSIAYVRSEAEEGRLKQIIIDRIVFANTNRSVKGNNLVYVDRSDSMFHDRQLCTLQEAQNIIGGNGPESYQQRAQPLFHEPHLPLGIYPNGTTLFVRRDANLGKLTRVTIWRTLPASPNVYEDKFKSLWNANELIPEKQARQLALTYWTKRRDEIKNALNRLI